MDHSEEIREMKATKVDAHYLKVMQKYYSIFKNEIAVSAYIFFSSNYHWNNDGELVPDFQDLDNNPDQISEEVAYRHLINSREFVPFPATPFWSNLSNIPENATWEWREKIFELCNYYLEFKQDEYEVHLKSYCFLGYHFNNPMIRSGFWRMMETFKEAIPKICEVVISQGWRHSFFPTEEEKDRKNKIANEIVSEVLAEEKIEKEAKRKGTFVKKPKKDRVMESIKCRKAMWSKKPVEPHNEQENIQGLRP